MQPAPRPVLAASPPPRIRLLPAKDAARLRSTLTITTLTQAVSELVQNSLDAGAHSIRVHVNFVRNSCVVEDDGCGIAPEDVPLLGQRHATSKYAPGTTPFHQDTFGHLGVGLASLATLSLLTILTRCTTHRSTQTARFAYSPAAVSAGPAPDHQRLPHAGTTVRIEGLFANLPVRVLAQQTNLDEDREWDGLRRMLAALLLAHAGRRSGSAGAGTGTTTGRGVAVIARDASGRKVSIKPNDGGVREEDSAPQEIRLLQQAYSVADIGPASVWERVRAARGGVSIEGWICTLGSPSRRYQFISINSHPLEPPPQGSNVLHATLNTLFAHSTFGIAVDNPEEKTTKKANRPRKGVDRFPRCVLRIECQRVDEGNMSVVVGGEGGTGEGSGGKGGMEGDNLRQCVNLLQKLVEQFLKVHSFRPRGDIPVDVVSQDAQDAEEGEAGSDGQEEEGEEHGDDDNVVELEDPSTSAAASIPPAKPHPPLPNPFFAPRASTTATHSRPSTASSTSSTTSTTARPSKRRRTARPPSSSSSASITIPNIGGWSTKTKPSRQSVATNKEPWRKPSLLRPGSSTLSDAPSEAPSEPQKVPDIPPPSPLAASPTAQSGESHLTYKNPVTNKTTYIDSRTGNTLLRDPTTPSEQTTTPLTNTNTNSSSISRYHRTQASENAPPVPGPGPFIQSALAARKTPIFGIDPTTGRAYSRANNPPQQNIQAISTPLPLSCEDGAAHAHHQHPHQPSSSSYFAFDGKSTGLSADGGTLRTVMGGRDGGGIAGFVPTRLTREGLSKGRVVGQVDGKFILVVVKSGEEDVAAAGEGTDDTDILVLIDQHAADERWRVELLFEELCRPLSPSPSPPSCPPTPGDTPPQTFGINTTTLQPAQQAILTFPTFTPEELAILSRDCTRSALARWGIGYVMHTPSPTTTTTTTSTTTTTTITITHLPPLLHDRILPTPLLARDILKHHLWDHPTHPIHPTNPTNPTHNQKWYTIVPSAPRPYRDIIASKACRSAIMFGDVLCQRECAALLRRLVRARWWGVCAHGRPVGVGVVRLGRGSEGVGGGEYSASGIGVGGGWRVAGGGQEAEGDGQERPERWREDMAPGGFVAAYRRWREREKAEEEEVGEDGG